MLAKMKNINLALLKLTIIIPIFNEESTIERLLDKIEDQNYIAKQLILVDDKSTDNSLDIIKNYNFKSDFKIIKNSTNEGKGSSIIKAKEFINGNLVLIQDADLEYSPSDYKILLDAFVHRKENIIYGSRLLKTNLNFISKNRIFANKIMTKLSNILNSQNLTDAHTCYKMFDAEIFKKIELKEKGFSFCPEINTKIANIGEKIYEVPINYNGRTYEEGKKIKFIHGIEAILTILKYKK